MGSVENTRIIVISDTHLGHSRANVTAFNAFLQWLAKGDLRVRTTDGERELPYPDTLLLLGDILELWEPANDSFGSVGDQSKMLLEKLIELPCKKIYVLGNHDTSLEELRAKKYRLPGGDFEIFYNHFPAEVTDTVTIGAQKYFFMHGHQFDKDTRKFGKWGEIGPSILLSLQKINKKMFRLHGFGSLLLALLFYCLHLYFGDTCPLYGTAALSPFWGTNLLWRMGRPVARRFCKAREERIYSIVEHGWYEAARDTIAADNLVFAHTHAPGIERGDRLERTTGKRVNKELLVNSGSWFSGETIENTFLYIDADAILLFKWGEIPELVMKHSVRGEDKFK